MGVFSICKILILHWQKCYAIGQIFWNNSAIWSHCYLPLTVGTPKFPNSLPPKISPNLVGVVFLLLGFEWNWISCLLVCTSSERGEGDSRNERESVFLFTKSMITPTPFIPFDPCPVWPDLAKFCHFGKILQVFGQFWKAKASIWQFFKPTLENCYAFGQVSFVMIGPILENNLPIWSYCR